MKDFKRPYSTGKSGFGSKRSAPSFGHDSGRSDEPHKTTCDGCHAPCEVPFIPNGKKPVYCRNCYKTKGTTTSFTGQPFPRATDSGAGGADAGDLKKQFSALNTKLDRLISAIEAQTRAL